MILIKREINRIDLRNDITIDFIEYFIQNEMPEDDEIITFEEVESSGEQELFYDTYKDMGSITDEEILVLKKFEILK